jgi:dienelactone hydrolase
MLLEDEMRSARWFSVLIGLWMAAAPRAAVAQAAPQPQPPFDPVNTRLLVRVSGADQVKVTEKVVFKTVDGQDLAMDVYGPRTGPARPAVVLVSGAPAVRHWGLYRDYGRFIGAANLVAVVPDKRFQGPQSMEHAAQDTLDLLTHLRQNAAKYNIDPRRVCMWTFSAGGALAQLGIAPENGFACLIAYYGLGQAGPRIALRQHAEKMPPMLIVRAGRDSVQLNNALDLFASAALMLNAPVSVFNYPAGLHAFEVEDHRPEPKEPANIVETERILRLTLDWLNACIK